jgi:phosphatidylinositol-4,5-bisphosphate 3-kinase
LPLLPNTHSFFPSFSFFPYLNSDTTSGIQIDFGGGAAGALKKDPILKFLQKHNTTDEALAAATDNFIRSCAGYCVATFVLGIGDRHNGNIMVQKDGHFFHIDFGHFLGNFKSKFGINRERAAFVLTPEMAFVIGGEKFRESVKYRQFLALCTEAYMILRAHASLLETLFTLMVPAGMPELMEQQDINYMREQLHLEKSAADAEKSLKAEIDKSLNSTYRRVDNYIHNLKHG